MFSPSWKEESRKLDNTGMKMHVALVISPRARNRCALCNPDMNSRRRLQQMLAELLSKQNRIDRASARYALAQSQIAELQKEVDAVYEVCFTRSVPLCLVLIAAWYCRLSTPNWTGSSPMSEDLLPRLNLP